MTGGDNMATKSITKNIVIRDHSKCGSLVRALERSASAKPSQVVFQRPHSDMSVEEIDRIFGGKDDRLQRG